MIFSLNDRQLSSFLPGCAQRYPHEMRTTHPVTVRGGGGSAAVAILPEPPCGRSERHVGRWIIPIGRIPLSEAGMTTADGVHENVVHNLLCKISHVAESERALRKIDPETARHRHLAAMIRATAAGRHRIGRRSVTGRPDVDGGMSPPADPPHMPDTDKPPRRPAALSGLLIPDDPDFLRERRP